MESAHHLPSIRNFQNFLLNGKRPSQVPCMEVQCKWTCAEEPCVTSVTLILFKKRMQFLIYSSLSLRRIGYSAVKPKKYQCEVNYRQNTQVTAPSSRLSHSRVLPSCCVNSLKVNLRNRTGQQTRLPLRGSSLVGTRDEPLRTSAWEATKKTVKLMSQSWKLFCLTKKSPQTWSSFKQIFL